MDNKELITEIRAGNREAFDYMCGLYYTPLMSYARLLVGNDWAQDIVQEVFANVWTRRGGVNPDLSLYSYLMRSVYNTAVNFINRNRQGDKYMSFCKERIETDNYEMYDPDSNPVIRRIYSIDMRKNINRAIERLPKKRREVFRMNYVLGMSHKEISKELGISVSTVENHVFLALQQLRTILAESDFK